MKNEVVNTTEAAGRCCVYHTPETLADEDVAATLRRRSSSSSSSQGQRRANPEIFGPPSLPQFH